MPPLQWLWTRRALSLKVVGFAFLVAYFLHHRFRIEGFWVGISLAIEVGVSVVFALLVNPVLERFVRSQRFDPSPYARNIVVHAWRRPLRELLLLPGEDGFFLVPLLWVGITPISAACASVAYGAVHYPQFPAKYCAVKSVSIFVIALTVLPHGLGSVIVGHLVADAIAFLFGRKLLLGTPSNHRLERP
jgi:hypothetical protein